MAKKIKYFIGIDGGGSGTRVILADAKKKILAQATGAPSALGQGIDEAWNAISAAMTLCFEKLENYPALNECALGIGISGANNASWKEKFIALNPGLAVLEVETDGFTTLLGAHAGKAGRVIAIGTGTVGVALLTNGKRKTVAGWGFPSGDEASGSWLGLHAANLTQRFLDGRDKKGPLTSAVLKFCGGTTETFLAWLGGAQQNQYAQLAPFVFKYAKRDPRAKKLLLQAGKDILLLGQALDPSGKLPLAMSGRIGIAMLPFLPRQLKKILQKPLHDSTYGALQMVYQRHTS